MRPKLRKQTECFKLFTLAPIGIVATEMLQLFDEDFLCILDATGSLLLAVIDR